MNKLKILYTIPNFITAGSGRVMVNILEGLDPQRFEPSVCVLKRGGKIEAELEARGIPLLELPFTVPPKPYATLLQRARQAAIAFASFEFDLWHSFHYADDYTEPLIARFAGAKGWIYTKKAMGWGSRAWVLRSVLASQIVADNSEMPNLFFNHWGLNKKTKVIHHGVKTGVYKSLAVDREKWQDEHSIPKGSILLGCVAHLVPVKGHPTLIEAVSKFEDLHLCLAGEAMDQNYAKALKNQVNGLGLSERVHFLGNVSDIPAFLAQMDVVVLPTWNRWRKEGCPVALLEAMACAKACVATDVPGSRDIIEDGVSGLLVPAEDAPALAAAINRLAQSRDLREQMGAAARERVVSHFSIEKEVSAHQQLYLDVMARKGLFRSR